MSSINFTSTVSSSSSSSNSSLINQKLGKLTTGFTPGNRIGTQGDKFFVIKKEWFSGWKAPSYVETNLDTVIQKVSDFIKKNPISDDQKTKLADKISERQSSLKGRANSWWRRLFMSTSTLTKINNSIKKLETLRQTITGQDASPPPPPPPSPKNGNAPNAPPPPPLNFTPRKQTSKPPKFSEVIPGMSEQPQFALYPVNKNTASSQLAEITPYLKNCRETLKACEEYIAYQTHLQDAVTQLLSEKEKLTKMLDAQKEEKVLTLYMSSRTLGKQEVKFYPEEQINNMNTLLQKMKGDGKDCTGYEEISLNYSFEKAIPATEKKIEELEKEGTHYSGKIDILKIKIPAFEKISDIPLDALKKGVEVKKEHLNKWEQAATSRQNKLKEPAKKKALGKKKVATKKKPLSPEEMKKLASMRAGDQNQKILARGKSLYGNLTAN